ncbi:MAG TPA: NlpC/P60 family protein [Gaiellaceae bacterium]|nr:NlpC/P60 family protein [Gaiellaceae bacterium]
MGVQVGRAAVDRDRVLRRVVILAVLACAFACTAAAAPANWAAPQIAAVTNVGILGTSATSFRPQSPLTQAQLADAIAKTDAVQHPAALPPPPVELASNVGPDAVVAGFVSVQLDVTGLDVDHVAFALDGTGVVTTYQSPYSLELDTTTLTDGVHALAVNVSFTNGGYAIATWQITVANAPGATLTPTDTLVPLTIAKSRLPVAPAPPTRTLYRAAAPDAAVSVKKLDAVLVGYLDLGGAAREIQSTLAAAGLNPPANTGTEAVARMLGLRLNHPAAADGLELRPLQAVTRAEAAYSFAQLLTLDDDAVHAVQAAADAFTLPGLTPWQQRILTSAIHYVGYPYVWGGMSPAPETLFGVRSGGGFDCSGFVWRVYKLTPYPDEGTLASVLKGRTTYQMSGEVGLAKRIAAANLQPGDVMFFGANGPKSKPGVVDHTGLYLGNGWFVQSSGEGVTLRPFDGWYTRTFAWARRPLREAGLSGS